MYTGYLRQVCVADAMFKTGMVRNEAQMIVRGLLMKAHISLTNVNHIVKAKLLDPETLLASSCHTPDTVYY